MPAIIELDQLLRSMEPVLNPGTFVFASLPAGRTVDPMHIVASVREPEGLSVILAQEIALREGLTPLFVCGWITLHVHSDLHAVGLTAAFSAALGRVGISCNVVAGAFHDHIFVPQHQAQPAMDVLARLQQDARESAGRGDAPVASDIRVATLSAADVARYRALMLEAYAQAPEAFTSTAQERAVEPESWWLRRIADAQGMSVVFGAFRGPDLVGAVALEFSGKPKTRHKAHLIGMYVQPAARGSGAGRQLLAAALAHLAGRSDIAVVVLTVTEGNTAAVGLYQAAGFEVFGNEPMAVRTQDGYKAKLHMCCRLGGAGGPVVESPSVRSAAPTP